MNRGLVVLNLFHEIEVSANLGANRVPVVIVDVSGPINPAGDNIRVTDSKGHIGKPSLASGTLKLTDFTGLR